MSAQKTLFNINFNPMRGEDILFEFKDIIESKLYKKESSIFHLLIGVGMLIIGVLNQIFSDLIPRSGIPILDEIIDFVFTIPFLFLFIGLLEIIVGSAKKFKKFFTLLYRHISHLYSKTSVEFLVTNYRFIYIFIGEGGLGSTITDFFYDQIETMTLTYPVQLKSKRFYYLIIGVFFLLFPLILYLLDLFVIYTLLFDSIVYMFIGFYLLIKGILLKAKYSPYFLNITMNKHDFTYQFIFPFKTPNLDCILKQGREFKLGGNRP